MYLPFFVTLRGWRTFSLENGQVTLAKVFRAMTDNKARLGIRSELVIVLTLLFQANCAHMQGSAHKQFALFLNWLALLCCVSLISVVWAS